MTNGRSCTSFTMCSFRFVLLSPRVIFLIHPCLHHYSGVEGNGGGGGRSNILKWEVMLLYCATRTHSTLSFDVLLFDVKKSIVICLSEWRNYLWIYSVTMGRPKTTRKSRNCNASTYTSKSVFKNKKTILRRLRSAFCVEIDSQAVN